MSEGAAIAMKSLIFAFCVAIAIGSEDAHADSWQPSPGHTQVQIWPAAVPDAAPAGAPESVTLAESPVAGKPWTHVRNVTQPTMTVYAASGRNTGVAVIVFPGGGYKDLAIDLEGTEVCDWLTRMGITCVVLKYRVPDSGPHWEAGCDCHVDPKAPLALEDAQRTVGLVRHHASQWQVDPHKIGVLGFSAGGHLVADLSTHWEKRSYPLVDAADKESCRPDFAVALYPGHMREKTTREFELNPTLPVSRDTPSTFLLQAEDDPVDDPGNALVYYLALRKAGVPAELHYYAHGGHAFGLRRTNSPITRWPELVETWLGSIGMISQ